jgi:hypothetical protein
MTLTFGKSAWEKRCAEGGTTMSLVETHLGADPNGLAKARLDAFAFGARW